MARRGKAGYYVFLAGIIRNGILQKEKDTHDRQRTQQAALPNVGPRVFSESATKWKALKVDGAKQMLARMLPEVPELLSWFNKGEDRLAGLVAVKAVKFLCGVQDGTLVPHGHEMGAHVEPISELARERMKAIGNKITDMPALTKISLDVSTDWFRLVKDTSPWSVVLNDVKPHKLDLKCVSMEAHDDWEIWHAGSFAEAILWTPKGRFGTSALCTMLPEKAIPVFDEAFHYAEKAGGAPGSIPSGAAATAALRSFPPPSQ